MGHKEENKQKYGAKVGPKWPQGAPKWATKAKMSQILVHKWAPKGGSREEEAEKQGRARARRSKEVREEPRRSK